MKFCCRPFQAAGKWTLRAKLKAASEGERLHQWKEHFKNLLRKPPKITVKLTEEIINSLLDNKLEHLMEELDAVLKKIKCRKAVGFNKILHEIRKTVKFDDILFQLYNAMNEQNTIEKCTNGLIFPFLEKGDLRITNNDRDITLTVIAAKVYNALLLNHILPEVEKIMRNPNGFLRNRPLQGVTSTLFLFIICLDCILQMSISLLKENGLTLTSSCRKK